MKYWTLTFHTNLVAGSPWMEMKKQILGAFWVVLAVMGGWSAQAQQSTVDSLQSLLGQYQREEAHERLAQTHNELAWYYRDERPDSALYHANVALRISRQYQLPEEEIKSVNYVGVAYRNLSNFSKAFEMYILALKLSEERNHPEQRGYSLINLGNLYLYQTNFQGAIRYFIQALDQAQILANKRMMAYCYLNLGRSYKGTGEYGQAELYFKQAIDIRREMNDLYGELAALLDLSDVYQQKGDIGKAIQFNQDLINRIESTDNLRLLAVAYNQLARGYLTKGQLDLAERNARKALAIAKEVNSRYDEKNILENLSMVYANSFDFQKAYDLHVQYSVLNQQLFSEENIRRIEQMKGQYEMEKQEVENEFLRKQTELNEEIIRRQQIILTLAVVGSLLFLTITIVATRAYLVKKRLSNEIKARNEKISKDKELIEQQSNKLKELDEAKSRFFANVSHDLRTPLSLIMGNLDILKGNEEVYLTPEAHHNLDIALKNCKRLLYLTDEINDLTKLEEGKINLRREVVRINSYLKMLTEMFVGTAEYKGVHLEFAGRLRKEEAAFLDPRQFEKIFYNLVSNAIRHTSRGQRITIEAVDGGDRVLINVTDTGEGIPSESLPYIFDRFYQSKSNEYRTREGLGIGLALVKELVELHNGTIAVESTYGLGTSFKMSFPKAESVQADPLVPETFGYVSERKHLYDEIDRENSAGLSLPKQSDEKETVLLVDDHPEIRYHIRQILEEDYHVIEAAHGIEALDQLKRAPVSLIITDLVMPWMDGFELIAAINNHEEFRKIPILVVSARISDDDQERVLDQGVNDFLRKPFQKKELILRINNLLQQRQKYETGEQTFDQVFDKNRLDRMEKDILAKLEQLVMDRIDDENLNVYDLAEAMAASERQVYRLVKKITNMTPYEYVTEIRMKYVEYLIRKGKVKNASEAARSIGLKNVTTFSRQFEKKFGVKPAEILKAQSG